MSKSITTIGLVGGGVVWLLAAACISPPVETPQTHVRSTTPVTTAASAQNKVDILFMVDNSQSMLPMQQALQANFTDFLRPFEDLAMKADSPQYADLHIAIVTSDYGAGLLNDPNSLCLASPGPAGSGRGLFQTNPAMGVNTSPPPGCQQWASQENFIEYAFGPGGKDACNFSINGGCTPDGLNKTFTCMAAVGANGCGFEHQLETVYAALTGPTPEVAAHNAGFLRDDALLVVVFVTNEDDGSVPPTSDVFTDTNIATYGGWDTYRQTHFGIACSGMLTPIGAASSIPNWMQPVPLVSCVPAAMDGTIPMVAEYDISRYQTLFNTWNKTLNKADPASQIILVALDGPDENLPTVEQPDGSHPLQLVTADWMSGKNGPYTRCMNIDEVQCLVRLDHSCQNQQDKHFFADPAIRLNTVIRSHKSVDGDGNVFPPIIKSICGDDPGHAAPNYTAALSQVANLITSKLKPSCIDAKLLGVDGQPNAQNPLCSVEDIDANGVGHPMPQCAAMNTVYPCWDVQPSTSCLMSPDKVQIVINRNGQPPPANTKVRVECQTCALDPQTSKCVGES